jgi:hypothetical protein
MPVDPSRSCSLLVVKNHHRDWSSQHHPRARVAERARPFGRDRSNQHHPDRSNQHHPRARVAERACPFNPFNLFNLIAERACQFNLILEWLNVPVLSIFQSLNVPVLSINLRVAERACPFNPERACPFNPCPFNLQSILEWLNVPVLSILNPFNR